MPGLTGEAFAARIQAQHPAIRVLFMSGYERPGGADGWPEVGTQVIAKPFSRAALVARVTQLMTEDIGENQVDQSAQLVRVRRRLPCGPPACPMTAPGGRSATRLGRHPRQARLRPGPGGRDQ
jgi:hypothetical protein